MNSQSKQTLRVMFHGGSLSPKKSIKGKKVVCATCGNNRRCVNHVCYKCIEKDFRKCMETDRALEDRKIKLGERNQFSFNQNCPLTDGPYYLPPSEAVEEDKGDVPPSSRPESSLDDDDLNFSLGDEGVDDSSSDDDKYRCSVHWCNSARPCDDCNYHGTYFGGFNPYHGR